MKVKVEDPGKIINHVVAYYHHGLVDIHIDTTIKWPEILTLGESPIFWIYEDTKPKSRISVVELIPETRKEHRFLKNCRITKWSSRYGGAYTLTPKSRYNAKQHILYESVNG